MTILFCLIKGILFYLSLMFAGSNLLGFIVRGFVAPHMTYEDYLINEDERPTETKKLNIIIAVIGCLISMMYFYALYNFWNFGVAFAAGMIMFARIPDLLYEIKTGKKYSFKTSPMKLVDIFCTTIYWLAIPVLWYSLCYLN